MPSLAAAGAGVNFYSTLQQGRAADKAGKFQDTQDIQQAGQVMASSERQESNAELQGTLVDSSLIAKAGMGGASVDNPNIVNDIGNINTQAHYNAMNDLYNGTEKANSLDLQGEVAKEQGEEAKQASYYKAFGGLMGAAGGSSMLQQYSPTGTNFTGGSGGMDEADTGSGLSSEFDAAMA